MTAASLSALSSDTCDSLPEWNLSDLYSGPSSAALKEDIESLTEKVNQFQKTYETLFSKGGSWQPSQLLEAIQCYENLEEQLGKLISYGYLEYATQQTTPSILQFFQMIQEKVTTLSAQLIFFTLDLNLLSNEQLSAAYTHCTDLKKYQPWIDNLRLFRPHQLASDLEKLLHEKSITGRTAWVRLYDETLSAIPFSFQGDTITLPEILNYQSSKDPHIRKEAALSLCEGLQKNISVFTLITNTLAKDKEIEDTWRRFPAPESSRHLGNQVEEEVVNALVAAVKQSYPQLSHRYYAYKAKKFKVDTLNYWDRNAPYDQTNDQYIPWHEAKNLIQEAYHSFSPQMATLSQKFFDHNWIHASLKQGKQSGAFSHSTVPCAHPYILVNYQGKLRDVTTLAHELGHGVHQLLAAEQGPLLCQTPLTIAETASVFGEMLTFKALLAKETDPSQRKLLIASKIEDMLNTVVRQVAFYDFEQQVHNRRRQGELSTQDIGEIWIQTQKESLGGAVHIDPALSCVWAYVSHFIHAPFYVYAYAFGDCLVNSLYAVYESGHPEFVEKYLTLLKTGGSKHHTELLAPFNLDARNPQFWLKGLSVITNLMDELEA